MSEFIPVPVFVKENEINQELSLWDERKNYFQSIIDRYNTLNLTDPLLENDLHEMVNTPKKFLFKRISEDDELNIGGLKLDAEKAFDLIEKPKGTNEFIEFVENSKKKDTYIKWFYRHADFFVIIDNFAELKPSEIDRIKTQNTIFLKSKKDKDIYDLLNIICNGINRLNELQRLNHIEETLFRELININSHTGVVSIKETFLQNYN